MKRIIGKKKPNIPEQNLIRLANLNREVEKIRPYKKPRGVYRFRTYDELYQFMITRAAKKL